MTTSNINQQDTMAAVNDSIIEEEEPEESTMTLVEHLEELRWRIFKSLIAITLAAIVAFIFRIQIMAFRTLPLPKNSRYVNKRSACCNRSRGRIYTYLKLALAVGFVIALPVILYQTWAFISPGLYERERKMQFLFIAAGICFICCWYCSGIRRPTIPGAVVTKFCVRQLCPTHNCR